MILVRWINSESRCINITDTYINYFSKETTVLFFFSVKTDKNAYWDNVYIPPWCRVSAYCVGMMLGVILLKRPKQKLHWVCKKNSACFPI